MKTDEEILKEDYPELTQEVLHTIDATPNEEYPLRILRAYRENCNSLWETNGLSEGDTRFWEIMNEHQRQRAEILDRAIKKLTNKTDKL